MAEDDGPPVGWEDEEEDAPHPADTTPPKPEDLAPVEAEKEPEKPADAEPELTKEDKATLAEILDLNVKDDELPEDQKAWCEDVAKRAAKGEASLSERLTAIQLIAATWALDGFQPHHKFKYHSIDKVSREMNALTWKYRVRIMSSLESYSMEGKEPNVVVLFTAHTMEDREDRIVWRYGGQGKDLTIAQSYAVKYGIVRPFWVGDGGDPDALRDEPTGGGRTTTTRTGQPAQRPAAASGATTAAPESTDSAPAENGAASPEQDIKHLVALSAANLSIPGWFPVKATELYKGKMSATNANDAWSAIFDQLEKAHAKKCGPDCAHIQAARAYAATRT